MKVGDFVHVQHLLGEIVGRIVEVHDDHVMVELDEPDVSGATHALVYCDTSGTPAIPTLN